MAGNMDPNEIQGVSDAMEELRKGSTLSAESLTKLGGNSTAAYKALEGYTKSLLGATGAIGGMAKSVAQGEGNFASLGATIVGLTSVVGKLASAIPIIGGAAKALAEGVGDAAKFVLDQLDIMSKNYQTLGDASAGAADGIDGLMRQFNQMGNYSLPAFTKAVKANSVGLAALAGTAAMGAEELSNVAGAMTTGDIARRFLKLGMSIDGVGDAAAGFVATNAQLGLLQGATTDELITKTQNYIEEVDKIARITGQSRKSQEEEAQKTLINVRFRAKLADMAARGQAKEALQLKQTAEGLGGAVGESFRAWATGIPGSKDAARTNILFQDALRQNAEAVKAGKQSQDAINDIMVAGAAGAEQFNTTLQFTDGIMGSGAKQALDYQQQVRANMAKGMTPLQAATAAQEAQATATGELTEDFVDANLAVANSSKNLQSLGFSLAKAAVPAVKLFAEVLDEATTWMNKRFGLGGTVPVRPSFRSDKEDKDRDAGAAGSSKNAETALKFFKSMGWTKEQAAGIVGNLQEESGKNLDTKAVGDGRKAKGIAQWHPDRQAKFQEIMGKQVMDATLEEQLKFVDWELKNSHKVAGDKLKNAKSAAQAAAIVDNDYEKSSGKARAQRMANANALAKLESEQADKEAKDVITEKAKEVSAPKKEPEKKKPEVVAPKEPDNKKPTVVSAPNDAKRATLTGPLDRHQTTVAKIDPVIAAGKPTQVQADQHANKTYADVDPKILARLLTQQNALTEANTREIKKGNKQARAK